MGTGLTDEDIRQIKRFTQTPRYKRTPDLLCSAASEETAENEEAEE